MPVVGFSHYNLRGSRADLEVLRVFYCDLVGLALGPRPGFASFGYWLYAGGRDVLHLSESSLDEPVAASPRDFASSPTHGFDHAAFSCVGLRDFERKLHTMGIRYHARQVAHTGQSQLFFRDPLNNGVELNFVAKDERD